MLIQTTNINRYKSTFLCRSVVVVASVVVVVAVVVIAAAAVVVVVVAIMWTYAVDV
jgi:hypothetical protein